MNPIKGTAGRTTPAQRTTAMQAPPGLTASGASIQDAINKLHMLVDAVI